LRAWAGRVLLTTAVALAACFFFARWAINAEGLGARDAGLALSLSFASVLTLYACAGVGALAAVLAILAALARRPWRSLAAASLAASLPLVYLALRDAF
jgi:exosortase/archaeosortase